MYVVTADDVTVTRVLQLVKNWLAESIWASGVARFTKVPPIATVKVLFAMTSSEEPDKNCVDGFIIGFVSSVPTVLFVT